ncbi:hypothetical protein [Escherichia coli]|uniref:hypothetical protein n=1 Tax=Escherichia coli TaxID=562 RepID=UPI0038600C26
MIQIDLPPLVKRLNLFSRQALEMAASECMSQQAAEITVSHVLIQMLAMPRSDLRVITRQGDIGMEELRQALTVENYTTARSADSYRVHTDTEDNPFSGGLFSQFGLSDTLY